MTAPPLDLDDHLVGRQGELAQLDGELAAAQRRGGACVLLSGVPGVGKSALLHAFGRGVVLREGLFAYGRFREGERAPYSAVAEALEALVRGMEAAAAPAERERWINDLGRGMAASVGALAPMVSGLDDILDSFPEPGNLKAADSRRRLQRAAIRLVAITGAFRPVVIALDDLQWADQDSFLLLSELLAASIRNVVIVGAHRAGEFDAGSIDAGSTPHTIGLEPLSRADLELLLAEVCGWTAELSDVAAEFQHRTGGNPLQIRQLLRQAQRAGALTRAAADGCTAWDLRALAAIEITPNVAEFLGRAIEQLRPSDQTVLSALACIGREFDLADAVTAAAQPAERVGRALWSALDLRLLEAVDSNGRRIAQVLDRVTRYRFSHDQVAEAARARLTEDAQRTVHLRVGRRLVGLGANRLFEAARHLGLGGVGLVGDAERTRFAEVERRAAEQARRQASFPVALACYRAGLALLGERRWVKHPALARELQLGAAEAAYLVSDAGLLAALLDEAAEVLDDAADRARLAFLRIKGLVAEHRLAEAMEIGLSALDKLGASLPRRPGKPHTAAALVWLKVRMIRWSDERLLDLPLCADQRIVEMQRILSELRNVSFMVRPELFPIIVRKELELTMLHGLVPSSPTAIASYGVLMALTGDYVGSQRFGEVGLSLADRVEFRDARPQTRFLHLHFIWPWQRPIAEALPQLREAVQDALDRGDLEYAGFLAVVLLYQSLWAGRPYPEVDALAQRLIPEIRSQHVPTSMCRSVQQLCLNLMGRTDDPFLLAGESGYDERQVLPAARREEDVVAQSIVAIIKMGLHFWNGDDAGAIPFAEETAKHLAGQLGTPNLQLYHLVNALCRLRARPVDPATATAARHALQLHRRWAAAAPTNYAAQYALIDGVWARARGNVRRAEHQLNRAITLAEEAHLPQISALAHEEIAALFVQTDRGALSTMMVQAAHERWLRLGLVVRTERLERERPWLASRRLGSLGSVIVNSEGVHRVSQALGAASTSKRLVEILLGAVADTTGAARVLLFVGEKKRIEIRGVHEAGVTEFPDAALGDVVEHDRSIVLEVIHSGRPVRGWVGAPARSALAAPVGVRGRTVGVVYVEHHEPGYVLSPEQENTLAVLCTQAAAPLWNFELEGRLHEADEHRQSLLEAQSRFIPAELLRILDIDDIRRVRRGQRVERETTVLISDIRGYTSLLEGMSLAEASELALDFLRAVEVPIITNGGLLQDVRGDEVLAVFDTKPDDAVRAGLAIIRSLREYNRERMAVGSTELRVGIGVNTGTVALGLVGGVNRMALTVIGDAVNLAARVESTTKRYGSSLLISGETHAQLVHADQFDIRRMERVHVVNRSRPVTIYEVYDEDPEPVCTSKRAAQPVFDEAFAWLDAGDVEAARAAFERGAALLPDDPVGPLHLAHCAALARGDLAPGQDVSLLQK
ncbi:MAG: AAA family ATPase [Pseudonocardiaceae bacterium]